MTQKEKILRAVKERPGLTACQYTKLLFPEANCYKPANVLRELQRYVKKKILIRRLQNSERKNMMAWRFYFYDQNPH